MDACRAAFLELLKSVEESGNCAELERYGEAIFSKQFLSSGIETTRKDSIEHYIAEGSGRNFWKLSHSNKTGKTIKYYVLLDSECEYCSCSSFKSVLQDFKVPFCKHILAIYICQALLKSSMQSLPIHTTILAEQEFGQKFQQTLVETTLGIGSEPWVSQSKQ